MNNFTATIVKPWILHVLEDYGGRFTLDGDPFTQEAIWIRGPKSDFVLSREKWDDDREDLERELRAWAKVGL